MLWTGSVCLNVKYAGIKSSDYLAEEPCEDFFRVQKRAIAELGTSLHYRRVDVREADELNKIIEEIATTHGRLDGLIAAAGIQQETPALEYSAVDANRMFEVNITGAFMTAQATAKQMIRFGKGGSIVMIASMSATIANRVSFFSGKPGSSMLTDSLGTTMCTLQRIEGRFGATRAESRK